jgi:guanylate kinase
MQKGRLYMVSGPSGVGKGTLCKALLQARDEIVSSISCATRDPRKGEREGVDYFFISKARFEEMITRSELLEYAQFNGGYYYGTPRAFVEKTIASGKSVLLEIEEYGVRQVRSKYSDAVSVFILPPGRDELIRRLVDRGTEDREKILRRIRKAPSELRAARNYTYLILNGEQRQAERDLIDVFDGNYRQDEALGALLEDLIKQFDDEEESVRFLNEYYAAHGKL